MSSNPEPPEPALDDGDVIVYAGDCIEVMRQLPEASVDAIVTDPPYGLGFMGKDWDAPQMRGQSNGNTRGNWKKRKGDEGYVPGNSAGYHRNDPSKFQAFSEAWAREAFRILRPGGHLLAFAGTRTYHRMASGVEDAGFEIRDCIAWMYGSGFPKSLDVSKAIDKAAGAEREIVGSIVTNVGIQGGNFTNGSRSEEVPVTAPSTHEAQKWDGWGTALKPAFEPVVVARKPLVGTVAQNVLEHGTGAINVDGCRIGRDADDVSGWSLTGSSASENRSMSGANQDRQPKPDNAGRWPANVTLDETAAAMLDEQSGERQAGAHTPKRGLGSATVYGDAERSGVERERVQLDSGGASRFFYTAKASRQDRNTGGLADNTHPTVKPTELMRWLIRLVTPPGGTILDPFGGSGSTGVAARAENVRCILIEREAEYLSIIRDRLAQQSLFAEEHREK